MKVISHRFWKTSHTNGHMGIPTNPAILKACEAAWRDPDAIDPRTSPDIVMAMLALRIAEVGLERYLEERPDTCHHPASCNCHACRLGENPQAILWQVRNVRSVLECDTPDSIANWLANLNPPAADDVVEMFDGEATGAAGDAGPEVVTLPLRQARVSHG